MKLNRECKGQVLFSELSLEGPQGEDTNNVSMTHS
jgi:hypothetical protein